MCLVHSRDLNFEEYFAAVLGPSPGKLWDGLRSRILPIWWGAVFQSSSAPCPRNVLTACYRESLLGCDDCGPLYSAGELQYEV